MNEQGNAKKIADVFADERVDVVALAQHSHRLFTIGMVKKLHQFIRWHSHIAAGRISDPHPIVLDELDKNEV